MGRYITKKIKEQRRFPRIKDNIFVSFQSMKHDIASFEAITKDISQVGLMFRASNFIPQRSELKLEICQPLNYNNDLFLSIPAEARIVWIKEAQEKNEYLVGAKITKMNNENQNRLRRYINGQLEE